MQIKEHEKVVKGDLIECPGCKKKIAVCLKTPKLGDELDGLFKIRDWIGGKGQKEICDACDTWFGRWNHPGEKYTRQYHIKGKGWQPNEKSYG